MASGLNGDGNFQDWENVVFKKKSKETIAKEKSTRVKLSDEAMRLNKIENSDGDEGHKKISATHRQLIQKARLAKKMSQKELAQKLNMDVGTIAQYENGKAIPNRQILNKFSRELNISFK